MPNFNIYIPNRYVELLEQEQQEEESLGLAAKRLLLDLLDRKIASNKPSDINLRPIEQRLESLEHRLDEVSNPNPNSAIDNAIEQRLEALEHRLEQSSNTSNNAGNVTAIDNAIEQRLEMLEQTLDHLSNTRASNQPSDSPVNLEELEMRVDMLEETLQSSDSPPIEQRLESLEQKLNGIFDTSDDESIEYRVKELEFGMKILQSSYYTRLENDYNIEEINQQLNALQETIESAETKDEEGNVTVLAERLNGLERGLEHVRRIAAIVFAERPSDNTPENPEPPTRKRGRPKKGF